jgi:hypothetical protein
METMDWATLQIVETHDDEGRIEIISENQMCELLGIFDEGTSNIPRQGCDRGMDEQDNVYDLGQDIDGAAIPTNDDVPGEMVITCVLITFCTLSFSYYSVL